MWKDICMICERVEIACQDWKSLGFFSSMYMQQGREMLKIKICIDIYLNIHLQGLTEW